MNIIIYIKKKTKIKEGRQAAFITL